MWTLIKQLAIIHFHITHLNIQESIIRNCPLNIMLTNVSPKIDFLKVSTSSLCYQELSDLLQVSGETLASDWSTARVLASDWLLTRLAPVTALTGLSVSELSGELRQEGRVRGGQGGQAEQSLCQMS